MASLSKRKENYITMYPNVACFRGYLLFYPLSPVWVKLSVWKNLFVCETDGFVGGKERGLDYLRGISSIIGLRWLNGNK